LKHAIKRYKKGCHEPLSKGCHEIEQTEAERGTPANSSSTAPQLLQPRQDYGIFAADVREMPYFME
jgi:hypothetical protein